MGRFFKTARPKDIDYSFKFPLQALARAMNKKDEQVDNTFNELDEVEASLNEQKNKTASTLGKGMYDTKDKEDYNAEMQNIETEIDKITNKISSDPLGNNASKDIRTLRTNVSSNFKSGKLYHFNKNAGLIDDFVKNNKSKDPVLVNTILESSKNKWGGTINEKGGFNTIDLPSTVYDMNVSDASIKYAKLIDPYSESKDRITGTIDSMKNNKEVVGTIAQELEYGLLKDNDGFIIDGSVLSPDEKEVVINDKIKELAIKSVNKTKKKYKTTKSSSKKIKEADKKYNGIDITNELKKSATVSNIHGSVESYRNKIKNTTGEDVTSYQTTLEMIDFKTKVLENTNSNMSSKMESTIESVVLQEQLKQADAFVIKQAKENPLVDISNPEIVNQLQQQFFDEIPKKSTMVLMDGWAKEMTNGMKTEINKQLSAVPQSHLNTITLQSEAHPELNGKSVDELKESGIVGSVVSKDSKKEYKTKLESLKNIEDLGSVKDVKEIKSKVDGEDVRIIEYTVVDDDDAGDYANDDYSEEISGDRRKVIIPMEKVEKDNFKLTTTNAIPTQVIDANGHGKIRLEATYNDKKISVYVNDNELKIPGIMKAKNYRPAPENGRVQPTNKETLVAQRMYNTAKSGLGNGKSINLPNGSILKKTAGGKMMLSYTDATGQNIELTDEVYILSYILNSSI